MRIALAEAVPAPAVFFEREPAGIDRILDLVCEVALVRTALQELGAALRGSSSAKRSARKKCVAASRCAPSPAARSPAAGA